jgi:very-short-patch-repair endonuclease
MRAESTDPADRAIAALAAMQHGVVTRHQLQALGLGRGAITHRIALGRLHTVHRGVFLVGHPTPLGRALEMAAVLACGGGAAIGRHSAGAVWSIPCGPPPACVEIVLCRDWVPRRRGVCIHRTLSLTRRDVRTVDGIPVTTPARTLLDLGAVLAPEALELAVADALRRRLLTRGDLAEQLNRNGHLRGAAALRSVLEADGGPAFTRSAAERRLLDLLRKASLPSPLINARVCGYEVDFHWPRERVIAEVDGFTFHGDRIAFERDRGRDAELQALGYRVIRITWRQLTREPNVVVRRITHLLGAHR